MFGFLKAQAQIDMIENFLSHNHKAAAKGPRTYDRVVNVVEDLETRLHKVENALLMLKQKYEPHRVSAKGAAALRTAPYPGANKQHAAITDHIGRRVDDIPPGSPAWYTAPAPAPEPTPAAAIKGIASGGGGDYAGGGASASYGGSSSGSSSSSSSSDSGSSSSSSSSD